MSYIEAVEDGIRHTDDPNGLNWYYPICHVCNMNEVPTWMYRRGVKYTCDICKLKENLEDTRRGQERQSPVPFSMPINKRVGQ